MAIDIVDFPINSMVIFHSYVTNYQRVIPDFLFVSALWGSNPHDGQFLVPNPYSALRTIPLCLVEHLLGRCSPPPYNVISNHIHNPPVCNVGRANFDYGILTILGTAPIRKFHEVIDYSFFR